MKTEGTLIYHKITVATVLLQNSACGHELVLFCEIIACVAILVLRPSTLVDAIDGAIN